MSRQKKATSNKKQNQHKLRQIRGMQRSLKDVILVNTFSPLAGIAMDRKVRKNFVPPPENYLINPQAQRTNVFKHEASALFNLRHQWTIFTSILCRKPTGELFFMHAEEITLANEMRLLDLQDYLRDKMKEAWDKVNPMYRLCHIWLARPCDAEFTFRQYISPIFHSRLLERHFTEYELTHPEHKVLAYKDAKNLDEFINAYIHYEKLLKRYRKQGQDVDLNEEQDHA